jgi:hypothetical protein
MKLAQLAILTSLSLLLATSAFAYSVSYEIDAYLNGIEFDGGWVNEFQEGIGSATFDAPASDGPALLVDFEIDILGEIFNEQDDFDFPDAPWATIEDGALVGISFSGVNDNGAYLNVDETFAFSMQLGSSGHIVTGLLEFREIGGAGGSGSGGGSGASVPEPGAALVFALGLFVTAPRIRRR